MAYKFTKEKFEAFPTYKNYRDLIDKLLTVGKSTGGVQNEARLAASKLNAARMNRIDKTVAMTEELKKEIEALKQHLNFALIAEGWCGDAANIAPVCNAISEYSDKINLRIILRDEFPEIMDEYLTNGSRSIPYLIVLSANFEEKAKWGPRPAELQKYVLDEKAKEGFSSDELKKNIQLWYLNDRTLSLQSEITELLKEINK